MSPSATCIDSQRALWPTRSIVGNSRKSSELVGFANENFVLNCPQERDINQCLVYVGSELVGDIALSRFLHIMAIVAEWKLYSTILEWLQELFIVHGTIDSTIHFRSLNSLEHCICTAWMTNIRPGLDSNPVPLKPVISKITGGDEWVNERILLYVAFHTNMAISRPKDAHSGNYVLPLSNDLMTPSVIHYAHNRRQHCTLEASKQFGALCMHKSRRQTSDPTGWWQW